MERSAASSTEAAQATGHARIPGRLLLLTHGVALGLWLEGARLLEASLAVAVAVGGLVVLHGVAIRVIQCAVAQILAFAPPLLAANLWAWARYGSWDCTECGVVRDAIGWLLLPLGILFGTTFIWGAIAGVRGQRH